MQHDSQVDELAVLQAVRLKGRVTEADLCATLLADRDTLTSLIATLREADHLQGTNSLRLTDGGRERLADLLTAERASIDIKAIELGYADFRSVNRTLKEIVTDWQIRDGEPNDHTDSSYDHEILARLHVIHQEVVPLIDRLSAQLPRLRSYEKKLTAALARIDAGDPAWFTRPTIDSYHTVWFELHEVLIGAAGLTRADEASTDDG